MIPNFATLDWTSYKDTITGDYHVKVWRPDTGASIAEYKTFPGITNQTYMPAYFHLSMYLDISYSIHRDTTGMRIPFECNNGLPGATVDIIFKQKEDPYLFEYAVSDKDSIVHTVQICPQPDKYENIIQSVTIDNINQTWASVKVQATEPNQAVAEFGTQSGVYTGKGRREFSFNYTNHSLRVGNDPDYPLQPGTTYYVRVTSWNENGKPFFSEEVSFTTAQ